MSAYLQRLVDQSGLSIEQPAPLAVTTPVSVPPAVSPVMAAPDLIEVDEERPVTTPPAPLQQGSPIIPPIDVRRASQPPLQQASQTRVPRMHEAERSTGSVAARSEETMVEETVVISSSVTPSPPPSPTPTLPAPPASDRASPITPVTHITDHPSEEVSSDLMQAVLKWIAAASPAPQVSATSDRADPLVSSATSPGTEKEMPIIAAEQDGEPPKTAERTIEIAEEHFDVPMPPTSSIASSPFGPPPMQRALDPSPAPPAHVSIGSIHVRVEAAPSAAAPLRQARTPEATRPTSSSRRGGPLSKLRRHYIVPH